MFQLLENKQKFIAQIITSKTPVRSAEDVDATALSYAEIKALATGNPLIIEKCQLENDVARLKLLKAHHLSEQYALEDKLYKELPKDLKRYGERVQGYHADEAIARAHPTRVPDDTPTIEGGGTVAAAVTDAPDAPKYKDYFPTMTIRGTAFSVRMDAGKAIMEACKAMTSPDPIALGDYRGFPMTLAFDAFSKEYQITLTGALSHKVAMGTDVRGNITRIDNALESFGDKAANCEREVQKIAAQMEAVKGEIGKPFEKDGALLEKLGRLAIVNTELGIQKRDVQILDDMPDEEINDPGARGRGDRDEPEQER